MAIDWAVEHADIQDIESPVKGVPLHEEEDMQAAREQQTILGGALEGLYSSDWATLGNMADAVWDAPRMFIGDITWTPEEESGITFMSTPEFVGLTEEEWDNLSFNERTKLIHDVTISKVRQEYNPDTDRAAYTVSKFLGSITSPTTAIPLKGPMQASAYGAVDASLYEYGTTGEVSPTTPIVAGVLGYGGGKVIQKFQQKAEVKQAQTVVDQLQNEISRLTIEKGTGVSPLVSFTRAKKNLGLTDETIDYALKTADKKLHVYGKKGAKELLEKNRTKKQGAGNLAQSADKIIEPISEGIKRISPRIYGKLNQAERVHFENSHKYMLMIDPFLSKTFPQKTVGIGKRSVLNKADQETLHLMMINKDSDVAVERFLREKVGSEALIKDYKMYRKAMDDMYVERAKAGEKIKKLDFFSPRRVRDYDLWFKGSSQKERSRMEKYVKQLSGKNIDELSKRDRVRYLNKYVNSSTGSKSVRKVTSAHKRKIEKISPSLVKAYEDPWVSAHKYIKESQEVVQRHKLFGSKNIVKKGGKEDDELTGTVGNYLEQELKAGRLNEAQVDQLKPLLEARFVYGPKQMNGILKTIKEIGYMSLLGHTTNAVRQFGDLALSAYKNGIVNTTQGAWQTLTKKGMTPKEMGLLDNVAQEFASDTMTKRALDFSFKYSGFKAVDAFGKGALVNGAIRKAQKQVKTQKDLLEFRNKWSSILGAEDASQVIKDLQAGRTTQLTKDVGFMELANIQPITLLEMPEAYLRNPNGRMLYMLKTFAMKHVNLMRQEITKEFAQGSKTKALKNMAVLSSYFTLGNMGVDKINDLILGRDRKLEETFYANLYRNTGLFSKYDVEQMARKGEIYETAVDLVAPPLDPLGKAAWEAGEVAANMAQGNRWNKGLGGKAGGDVISSIPIIGRLMKAWVVD